MWIEGFSITFYTEKGNNSQVSYTMVCLLDELLQVIRMILKNFCVCEVSVTLGKCLRQSVGEKQHNDSTHDHDVMIIHN